LDAAPGNLKGITGVTQGPAIWARAATDSGRACDPAATLLEIRIPDACWGVVWSGGLPMGPAHFSF